MLRSRDPNSQKNNDMKLQLFHYELPQHLIAYHPLPERDQARLLVIDRKKQEIQHDIFANVDRYLPTESCMVLNNSKVIPARLLTQREKTGGTVEVFVLKKLAQEYHYKVLMRPTKRLKDGEELFFDRQRLKATIVDKQEGIVRFNTKDVLSYLRRIGHIPLPPYIQRPDTDEDRTYYQTVYARKEGSVAAPTAGLHFTNPLLKQIRQQGHTIVQVTLHVSYGTFRPVEKKDITQHQMHSEDYTVSPPSARCLQKAKDTGQKIVAVGTTSCRVLETMANNGNLSGNTNLFIYPGYRFQMTDALITNFHLPGSTLLMLVYAFGGIDLMRKAYQEAIQQKYRFYSYGDAMIII